MLNIISKIIMSIVLMLSWGYIVVSLKNRKINIKNFRNTLCVIIMILCGYFVASVNLGFSKTLIIYSVFTICYKYIYDITFKESSILNFISTMVHFLSEIFLGILMLILNIDNSIFEKYLEITPISGLLIFIVVIIIWKVFKNKILKLNGLLQKEKISNIFYLMLIIFLAILLNTNINIITWKSKKFIINNITMIIFFVLIIFLMREKFKYNKINNKFNHLFYNSQKISSLLEKYKKINHEHKNDLLVIKSKISNNSSAEEYINLILNEKNIECDSKWISEINKINMADINGFLSLKLNEIIDNKVKIVVNISNNVKSFNFLNLKQNEQKDLCRILGVYLDNAYEACIKSKNKEISLEMNIVQDELEIIISNTFSEKLDKNKLGKYGYTTKGIGHGTGLALVNDIIKNNNIFRQKQEIIENYYFQYLYLK